MNKLELLNKEYKELEGNGLESIILYIHMPTGEEEIIINSNVEEKIKYINKAYNENLVHKGCSDIYITDYIFADKEVEGIELTFKEAFEAMKEGAKVKLPDWEGYWTWENESIIIHFKDGKVLDIRETETVEFTFEFIFNNICSDKWMIVK